MDINANTHSVELGNFDFREITTLEYDGKKINPGSAPKLSSHHGSGSLLFNVDGDVNGFTIRIKGVGLENERIFSWG